jgi:NADH-quinone oxidoreductase subunit L
MVWLTFFGTYDGDGHPHESPASMTGPLVALAAATVGVGFLGSPLLHAPFFKWVYFGEPEAIHFVLWIALLGTVAALGGIAVAYLTYKEKREKDPLESGLGPLWGVFQQRYYIDSFYMKAIIYPVRDKLSTGVYWFNQNILDGAVNGVAALARGLSTVVYWFDRNVIDGVVNAVGSGAEESGGLLKYLQSGNVQWYAVVLFVGVIAMTIIFVRA